MWGNCFLWNILAKVCFSIQVLEPYFVSGLKWFTGKYWSHRFPDHFLFFVCDHFTLALNEYMSGICLDVKKAMAIALAKGHRNTGHSPEHWTRLRYPETQYRLKPWNLKLRSAKYSNMVTSLQHKAELNWVTTNLLWRTIQPLRNYLKIPVNRICCQQHLCL